MISYLNSAEINREKWDACVQSSVSPSIFAYSWYLDAVCVNWAALILNDYETVFPFAFNKKFNIQYIYQPFFTRYFGIYSKEIHSTTVVIQFLDAIPKSFKSVKLCLNSSDFPLLKGYSFERRNYQAMDLSLTYEQLKRNFSDNTKRNIKKAHKANLKIERNISSERIVDLFRYTKGEELNTFKEADYQRLNKLMRCCLEQKCGETIAVFDQEELCAAAFFMYSDNRFVFLKSGVTEGGRTKGAMHFLIDHFIQTHSEERNVFDFGGSSVESVARFYKGFGAIDYVYLQLEKKSFLNIIKWMKSFKF
jgi:hypothetical protein